jgi:hypothetical protein
MYVLKNTGECGMVKKLGENPSFRLAADMLPKTIKLQG